MQKIGLWPSGDTINANFDPVYKMNLTTLLSRIKGLIHGLDRGVFLRVTSGFDTPGLEEF